MLRAETRSATAKRSMRLSTKEHASHTHTTACFGRSGACASERHVEARAKPFARPLAARLAAA